MSSDIHVMQVTVARLNPLVAHRWNISYSHGRKRQNPTFRVEFLELKGSYQNRLRHHRFWRLHHWMPENRSGAPMEPCVVLCGAQIWVTLQYPFILSRSKCISTFASDCCSISTQLPKTVWPLNDFKYIYLGSFELLSLLAPSNDH